MVAECLRYVLECEAGTSSTLFPNSPYPRDSDANGVLEERKVWDGERQRGMLLADFFQDQRVGMSGGIKIEHVAALRLYTTAAFKYINDPLRDMKRHEQGRPHPFPLIVTLITEAAKMLGAAEAEAPDAKQPKDLYRGMKGVALPDDFLREGGVDTAPMSTTSDLKIAMQYSLSSSSVLMRIDTSSFLMRGIGVRWLSAFPAEEEILYPPLTHLQAEGELEHFKVEEGPQWTIVTVKPTLA